MRLGWPADGGSVSPAPGLAAGTAMLIGVAQAVRALGLVLTVPALRRLALVPAAIGALLTLALVVAAARWGWPAAVAAWQLPAPGGLVDPQTWRLMRWAAALVVVPVLVALAAAGVLMLAPLLACPWLVLLSQRSEEHVRGLPPRPGRGSALVELTLLGLGDLLMTLLWLPVSHLSWLALWLLPGLGGLAALSSVAVWVAGLGLGLALARRGASFTARQAVVAAHRWQVMGTGAVLVLASWLPGLGLLAVPASAVAGVLNCRDLERRGLWLGGGRDEDQGGEPPAPGPALPVAEGPGAAATADAVSASASPPVDGGTKPS